MTFTTDIVLDKETERELEQLDAEVSMLANQGQVAISNAFAIALLNISSIMFGNNEPSSISDS
jgi:hypothetical protein